MINSEDRREKIKVITHEELALLWFYTENASADRHREKYLFLIPKDSKEEYLERAWKSYNEYHAYFESLLIKYIGPDARHEDWAIDHITGRIKPRI